MMDVFDQDKSNEEPTPAAPVPAGPDVSQADQVSDDTPGVDDSAPSENEEDNES